MNNSIKTEKEQFSWLESVHNVGHYGQTTFKSGIFAAFSEKMHICSQSNKLCEQDLTNLTEPIY